MIEMTLPDLSTTGGSLRITRWLIQVGQVIKRGQPIVEVETDKATVEVEAYLSGQLVEILADVDSEVEVGQAIARILPDSDGVGAATPAPEVTQAAPPLSPALQSLAAASGRPAPARTGMFARNRQKVEDDRASANPPVADPLAQSAAQRVAAQRMQESKQTIPHFYLQTSAHAAAAAQRRQGAAGEKPAWDAYFVFAAARALQKFPRLRASYLDGRLVAQTVDAVGVAVDLEGDLFVCPITSPALKSPEQISAELNNWVRRLKDGDPQTRLLHPTNLTVTNLGATGVEAFAAVINPPEAAILAVGKVADVVTVVEGQVAIQKRVTMTLSVDHRVANGRYAALFLAELVSQFENL